MRIRDFSIENQRNVHLARSVDVPRVMVITGPNGCGKSTLLYALRNQPGQGPILYVGPHRSSRRQTIRMRFLFQQPLRMRKLLAESNLPSYEGLNITNRARTAWDSDEASSFLKYELCQIELDNQNTLTQRFDAEGELHQETLPDIWRPLREMTENLLPHLKFHKIDVANRDQIQCLWYVHAHDIVVDIDDLSSGEKAIIQLFFPFIEARIHSRIERLGGVTSETSEEDVCVLMDEPDLHLHPLLQGKVLDYIRNIAYRENVQFIIATQSPIIVELANSDELYLLRPSELIPAGENQLVQVASDEDRLALLRDVFGTTAQITGLRPILIVEGDRAAEHSKKPADERIYRFLAEEFKQLTVVPGGGKAQCIQLAESLTELLHQYSPHLFAYALVDRDLEAGPIGDTVIQLPVSMVENFLVDPEVIWDAIVTVRHKTVFQSRQDVDEAIDKVLDDLEPVEVNRRIKAQVGFLPFRLTDPVENHEDQIAQFIEVLQAAADSAAIDGYREQAEREVEQIKKSQSRREKFSGKLILDRFYARYLGSTGMSREIFIYECAMRARKRVSVIKFVEGLFQQIGPVRHESDKPPVSAGDGAT